MTEPSPQPQRIPEESVAAILSRAAELDRTARETVKPEAVRTAALEAGISMAAVDAALEEYASAMTAPAPAADEARELPRWKRWLRKLSSPVGHFAGALAGWAFVGAAGAGAEPLVALGIGGIIVAAWRLYRRARDEHRVQSFAIPTALMSLGSLLGMAMVNGDEDVAVFLALLGVGLTVGGSALLALGRWRERRSPERRLPEPAS